MKIKNIVKIVKRNKQIDPQWTVVVKCGPTRMA